MQEEQNPTVFQEGDGEKIVARFLEELRISKKRERDWRKKAKKCWDIYKGEDESTTFNILYSNIQTIKPAVFNSIPNPDVRRRYKDKDKGGKQLADLMERALSYTMDNENYKFYDEIELAVIDYLITGRGVAVVDYAREQGIREVESQNEMGNPIITKEPYLKAEYVYCEHVPYNRMLIHAAAKWSSVPWIAFESFPTEDEARVLFPDLPKDVTLLQTNIDKNGTSVIGMEDKESVAAMKADVPDLEKRLQVFKIWHKKTRKIYYISPSVKNAPLAIEDDPFGLPNFFPCPRPLMLLKNTSDIVPVPEYEFYKEQAEELNRITNRLTRLIGGLKIRGFYNATIKEMADLSEASDYKFAPIDGAMLQDSSMDKNIWLMPVEKIIAVIAGLVQQRELVKTTIYEIIGISDILRGASNANETLGAQNIKAQFGGLRIDERRREISNFIRDILRIKAHLIAKLEPETLQEMTLLPVTPELMQLLQDQEMSGYRIDIETDSTVAGNIQNDQKNMNEMLTGLVSYMTGMSPLVASGAIPLEVAKEVLLSAVRRMKLGRTVEDALEGIGVQQAPQQPMQGLPQEQVPIAPVEQPQVPPQAIAKALTA